MAGDLREVEPEGRVSQLNPSLLELRSALVAADYTVAGVAGLLGPFAHAALGRNETVPGLRATVGGSPLATLTKLWSLQSAVPRELTDKALPGLVEPLAAIGVLECSGGEVRALLDVRPYADDDHDWWVVSDLTPGLDGAGSTVSSDYVLGVSSASTTLAQLTVREPAARALDLGTGCGVQSLHLDAHCGEVVATDVNQRALWIAGMNATLNEVELDLREGSFFRPVSGEQFDLIVTNPPFVISPGTGQRLVYRDSGMPSDDVVRHVLTAAPAYLRPGGRCQILANWAHTDAEPWNDRLARWLTGTGCDAWVVQRETIDPAQYVELWLKDAGLHGADDYTERYDTWLSWFAQQGIEGVGFGWVVLRRPRPPDGSGQGRAPIRLLEDWPFDIELPLGGEIADWDRRHLIAGTRKDSDLLGERLVLRSDVRQETTGEPGAAHPESIVLRQQRGMRRAQQVDTVEAAMVGACDGDLSIGQILEALGSLLELDSATLRSEYLPKVRALLAAGFLETGLR